MLKNRIHQRIPEKAAGKLLIFLHLSKYKPFDTSKSTTSHSDMMNTNTSRVKNHHLRQPKE